MGHFNIGSTISGGVENFAGVDAHYSTVGGGAGNTGGSKDSVAATVSGGMGNRNWGRLAGAISGGTSNQLDFYTRHAVIAGGSDNVIAGDADSFPAVAGGAIGGGLGNTVGENGWAAVVSGGESNQANGPYSAVAGGRLNLATNNAFAAGSRAKALHPGSFVWAAGNANDFPSGADYRAHFYVPGGFQVEYGGQIANGRGNKWLILASQTPGRVINVFNGAYLSEGGAWTDTSDRNAKENFESINPREILDGVLALPLTRWNYRSETNAVRHLGPVAQDFHRAFGLGADDKHIAGLDGVGVALAAIQGLHRKLEDKQAEIDRLKERLEALEQSLARLAKR
jgi:hypothetical protein